MANMWKCNDQEQGRCTPPYPWYWMIGRLQYAEKKAGYRQWTTDGWKDLVERITQGWTLVGKGLVKTVTTVIDVGQKLLNTLMKVVKWIIDNWYVLMVRELTGFNGILRHLLKVVCCFACNVLNVKITHDDESELQEALLSEDRKDVNIKTLRGTEVQT